jgi:hypothetical protein
VPQKGVGVQVPPPTHVPGSDPEEPLYYRAQTVDTGCVGKPRQDRTTEQLLDELGPIGAPTADTDGDVPGPAMRAPELAGTLGPEYLNLQRQRSRFVWSTSRLDNDSRIVLTDAVTLCGWAPHLQLRLWVTDTGIVLAASERYMEQLSNKISYVPLWSWRAVTLDARSRLTLPADARCHLGVTPTQSVVAGTLADHGGMVYLPAPSLLDFPLGDERIGMQPTIVTRVER